MFERGLSQRRACRFVGLSRTVARYASRRPSDTALRHRLRELAGQHQRYGYLRVHVLPGRERIPLAAPERRNQRWSLDFVGDSLCTGRRFRALTIVDDDSRESPGQHR